MLFTILLTLAILFGTLFSRYKRGHRLSIGPRPWEKAVLVPYWKGKKFHVHHGYWGIPLVIFMDPIWSNIGWALIISDLLFHPIATFLWGDPIWD